MFSWWKYARCVIARIIPILPSTRYGAFAVNGKGLGEESNYAKKTSTSTVKRSAKEGDNCFDRERLGFG